MRQTRLWKHWVSLTNGIPFESLVWDSLRLFWPPLESFVVMKLREAAFDGFEFPWVFLRFGPQSSFCESKGLGRPSTCFWFRDSVLNPGWVRECDLWDSETPQSSLRDRVFEEGLGSSLWSWMREAACFEGTLALKRFLTHWMWMVVFLSRRLAIVVHAWWTARQLTSQI
jgi:hypothetical protein